VQQVLPRFFKSHNFNSFQRQLNYFGFNKTSKDIIQYSLDLFHVDAPDDILLMNIATLVTSRHKWSARCAKKSTSTPAGEGPNHHR
jgi:hypothetical protein